MFVLNEKEAGALEIFSVEYKHVGEIQEGTMSVY